MPAKPTSASADSLVALPGSRGETGDAGMDGTALLVNRASPPAALQRRTAPAHLHRVPA